MFVKVEWSSQWQDVRTALGSQDDGIQTHLIEPIEEQIMDSFDSYDESSPRFIEDWYRVTSTGRAWKGAIWLETSADIAPLQNLEELDAVTAASRFESEPSAESRQPSK